LRAVSLILAAASLVSLPSALRATENESPATPATAPERPNTPDDSARTQITLDKPAPQSRFYTDIEYLYWWFKPAPLSVPLISTGPISTTHHGWLDSSDSTILYGAPQSPAVGGNDSQAFSPTSGARLTLGYWLDCDQCLGIEVSGFGFKTETAGYEIRSDSSGYPDINIPVLNTISYSPTGRPGLPAGGEDGLPAALYSDPTRFDGNAGVVQGGVRISNWIQLWGADANGVINLYRNGAWNVDGLAGFRYLDLSEQFNLMYDSEGVSGFYKDLSGRAWDEFATENKFYGGNFGLRARYTDGSWSAELSACAAPGLNYEVQQVSGGFFSFNYTKPTASGPEGVFAQPANEGQTSSQRFAIIPDMQFKLGYALTPWLRATLGYEFLYYSNVIRPGDQINREIPKGQTFQQGKATDSTESPSRFFKTTDFYAHGLSFGLEFTF
jgi:hypothetical protein